MSENAVSHAGMAAQTDAMTGGGASVSFFLFMHPIAIRTNKKKKEATATGSRWSIEKVALHETVRHLARVHQLVVVDQLARLFVWRGEGVAVLAGCE